MRRTLWIMVALLFAGEALAQGGPMGGGGGGPMGGGGGGGGRGGRTRGEGGPGGGGGFGGGGRPREMKPVKREALDKAVTAMFAAADTNHDGLVTIDEVHAIIEARRETLIRERFAAVDSNHDGAISAAEFMAWQRQMGSAASSEIQPLESRGGPIAETIPPKLGNSPEDETLALLIEPLSALTIVNANTNMDAGVSLEELLAYERKRFDAADTDGDHELTGGELRGLGRGRGPGGPGGGFGRPPGDAPACTGDDC